MKSNDEIYNGNYLPGSIIREEWDFLYEQTLQQGDNSYSYVEVGSHSGASTTALLINIVKENESRKVISIDNCSYPEVNREIFRNNLKQYGLLEPVEEVNTSSLEFDPRDNIYSIVFLDGDHTEGTVSKEIELFDNHIAVGGIICGHDYQNFAGVTAAVDKFFEIKDLYYCNERYELMSTGSKNMWAFKKIK